MFEHWGLVIAGLGLFLTWTGMLVGAILWLSGKFSSLELALRGNLSLDEYRRAHAILMHRVSTLERWALRLNGSVKVNFNEVSERDYITD